MTNCIKITTALGIILCLTGCGKDEEAQQQISELQDRLLSLEKDLANLKKVEKVSKDNSEYLSYLKPRIKQSENDVQKLIKGLASINPSKSIQTSQPFQTSSQLKSTEKAIQNSELSLEHKKSIALIKAYLRTKPISAIPEILNSRQSLHPDDNSSWDVQKLTRFIELYKIPKTK